MEGYIRYREINFQAPKLAMIRAIDQLCIEYHAVGLKLSVRQVFYQFISRGWEQPEERLYDRIQSAINDGRIAGLISWTAIEDRGRQLMGLRTQESPGRAINALSNEYRLDLWADQEYRAEVWVEKVALEGVIGGICNELRVDFYATRGYDSQSQTWEAGQRFQDYIRKGQRPIVFHLGDHDPSGIDMTRDLRERLEMFCGMPIIVERLALNKNQVDRYNPPPNPAKMKDSRAKDYVRKFGHFSWEVDALEPRVVRNLIDDAVGRVRDEKKFSALLAEEVEDRRTLKDLAEEFEPGSTATEGDESDGNDE